MGGKRGILGVQTMALESRFEGPIPGVGCTLRSIMGSLISILWSKYTLLWADARLEVGGRRVCCCVATRGVRTSSARKPEIHCEPGKS